MRDGDDEAREHETAFDSAVDWVERFHSVVDEAAAPVTEANASRLRCAKGCAACCTDELTVFPIEAEVIVRHHAELLREGVPHPPGACAFLDDGGACRVYAQRPYVCRTQGLPLRWMEEDDLEDGPEPVEARDICPLNIGGADDPPITELAPEHCWTLGPFESRLAARQASVGPPDARVRLRSLFESESDGEGDGRRRLRVV
jgi:hypothetical protein